MSTSGKTPATIALRDVLDGRRVEFAALLAKYRATNPHLFGSVARGTAGADSDVDVLVDMDASDGNILLRAAGLMEETRDLFGRDDIDIFPAELLKRRVSETALRETVPLNSPRMREPRPSASRPQS
ncbi:nucleotidyltransferase [Pseudoclavibacter chungangensis]|uniref:Nucleotidyltransferase n=1 Tax=Pseudoclavibacter chungangensis TaxID=587635 RepID=A0A7J5C1M3_9MICO|nr:nucleotidyltransferase domain-containing protein [Pseudoclavibacter chungangensis]KAB1659691.1 nucleotidyltransferase [Pseudoclavibacter chungangensis]NYJ67530.1 hypothetical protein [Pseudoclavibacter chungangensis]